MSNIAKAVDFLDSNIGEFSWLTADWRQEINLDELNMMSHTRCILGQLEGDYGDAYGDLDLHSVISEIREAFAGYGQEWIDYLTPYQKKVHAVGATLWGKHNQEKYTILASAEKNGVRYYVLDSNSGLSLQSTESIETSWTTEEPRKYKKGDIIALQGRHSGVYVIVGNNDYGLRIGNGDSYFLHTSQVPMSEYTRHEFKVVGNINDSSGLTGLKI